MTKTIKEERLRWVLPLIKKEVRLVDMVKVCPYGRHGGGRLLQGKPQRRFGDENKRGDGEE